MDHVNSLMKIMRLSPFIAIIITIVITLIAMVKMWNPILNKIEMWAYIKQHERESDEDRQIYLRKTAPLWLHRLHEHGATDQRNLGVVVGDVTIYGFGKSKYKGNWLK